MTVDAGTQPMMNAKGQRVCGAQLRGKPGRFCQITILSASNRCRLHGGASPRGMASPNWRTGRYSRELPTGLLPKFKVALADNDMLNLSREVALIDVRLSALLGKLDQGDARGVLIAARAKMVDFKAASSAHKMEDAAKALNELEFILARGATEYAQWAEVRELVDDRRKLVESERKRLVELRQVLTMEQALSLIAFIEGVIKSRVTDANVLAAIAADLSRVLGGPAEQVIDGVQHNAQRLPTIPVAGAGAP